LEYDELKLKALLADGSLKVSDVTSENVWVPFIDLSNAVSICLGLFSLSPSAFLSLVIFLLGQFLFQLTPFPRLFSQRISCFFVQLEIEEVDSGVAVIDPMKGRIQWHKRFRCVIQV